MSVNKSNHLVLDYETRQLSYQEKDHKYTPCEKIACAVIALVLLVIWPLVVFTALGVIVLKGIEHLNIRLKNDELVKIFNNGTKRVAYTIQKFEKHKIKLIRLGTDANDLVKKLQKKGFLIGLSTATLTGVEAKRGDKAKAFLSFIDSFNLKNFDEAGLDDDTCLKLKQYQLCISCLVMDVNMRKDTPATHEYVKNTIMLSWTKHEIRKIDAKKTIKICSFLLIPGGVLWVIAQQPDDARFYGALRKIQSKSTSLIDLHNELTHANASLIPYITTQKRAAED